ncbi:MAG: YkuS family protein, partial [Alicyclobacillus sp.]|nr:YkuS family protein [Alicyclobacillus sp.]
MKAVAVERGLEPVKQFLQAQGCQVVDWTASAPARDVACCCISGMDKNLMGMQDVTLDCPVVSCDG